MALASQINTAYKTLQLAAGVTIRYARGDRNVAITAVPGSTEFVQTTGDGYMETVESRDFLFPASDLNLGGKAVLPERGDTITETVDGVDYTYPVLSNGDRYFKYADPYRKVLRVYTKQTA